MPGTEVTTIAKDFHWEMGHRLPFHAGGCENIHGHSYNMRVVVTGTVDDHGMVIDYFDLASIVDPLVKAVDHSFLCDEHDDAMRSFFAANHLKHVIVPFHSTAENITLWMLNQITERLAGYRNLSSITVRVAETERTYAEITRDLRAE
jgi:6-pyruvoyltetrahydropterin/6-carboxytetrahydropterin synthase